MWTFFDHVLDKGGVVAVLFAVVVAAFVAVIRAFWNANQSREREYREAVLKHAKELKELQEQYTDQLKELQNQHSEAVQELQERRLQEAQATADRLLDTLRDVDGTIGKLQAALEALTVVMQDRRR